MVFLSGKSQYAGSCAMEESLSSRGAQPTVIDFVKVALDFLAFSGTLIKLGNNVLFQASLLLDLSTFAFFIAFAFKLVKIFLLLPEI